MSTPIEVTGSTFGRLERVELRDGWTHEATDFTPWLAKPENLKLVSDAIGIDLEVISEEHPVGGYKCDIVCRDVLTQRRVIIENQLERTNHSHLGQLLTYGAGLDARAIVWIAREFADPHRAALDWLNQNTLEEIAFFGLELELWRIGASAPAPKLNVVSKPNDWRRATVEGATSEELSEGQSTYLRYWTSFRRFVEANAAFSLRPPRPAASHYTGFAIGRSGFWLTATASMEKSRIGVELFIRPSSQDPKASFRALLSQRESIEREADLTFDWQELPTAKGCRVVVYKTDVAVEDESDWTNQFQWLATRLVTFQKVFAPRVRNLYL